MISPFYFFLRFKPNSHHLQHTFIYTVLTFIQPICSTQQDHPIIIFHSLWHFLHLTLTASSIRAPGLTADWNYGISFVVLSIQSQTYSSKPPTITMATCHNILLCSPTIHLPWPHQQEPPQSSHLPYPTWRWLRSHCQLKPRIGSKFEPLESI